MRVSAGCRACEPDVFGSGAADGSAEPARSNILFTAVNDLNHRVSDARRDPQARTPTTNRRMRSDCLESACLDSSGFICIAGLRLPRSWLRTRTCRWEPSRCFVKKYQCNAGGGCSVRPREAPYWGFRKRKRTMKKLLMIGLLAGLAETNSFAGGWFGISIGIQAPVVCPPPVVVQTPVVVARRPVVVAPVVTYPRVVVSPPGYVVPPPCILPPPPHIYHPVVCQPRVWSHPHRHHGYWW